MPLDIKGYKVVHGTQAYKGLMVEIVWYGSDEQRDGEIGYSGKLRVFIVDHDGKIGCIEDLTKNFAFLKE